MDAFERFLWGMAGVGVGHLIGESIGYTEEEKRENATKGRWIGGMIALGGTFISEGNPDTVNYILKNRGNRVYDGISKENRLDTRLNEHIRHGKKFDEIIFDEPKPRMEAENLERYRIKRFKSKYNVHFNN